MGTKAMFIRFAWSGWEAFATAGKDRTVRLWEVKPGFRQVAKFPHTDEVNCVAYAPDGKSLASCTDDGIIHLWDIDSEKEIRTFPDTKAKWLLWSFLRTAKRWLPAVGMGRYACGMWCLGGEPSLVKINILMRLWQFRPMESGSALWGVGMKMMGW